MKMVKVFRALVFVLILIIILLLFIQYLFGSLFKYKDVPLPVEVHPEVRAKTEQLITSLEDKGITILITDDYRSLHEQDGLYAKGRTEEGQIVTHAKGGESYHNYGLAVDFALVTKGGEVVWDMTYDGNGNGQADWDEVVAEAKKLGFEWGGDWQHFKDYPHLQYDFGLSINELQRGKRPPEEE
ncbi:peptidoglycan L-alanyl-D-glutamate endopeptidase CwlK [Cytobacillus kochii]|nr:M15 family metallopeptidase [Cytobacillus kochii]MDQ0184630.1 peptidoglycan L-alanyl-D-glutamate endopeptidase CwlK [Cytobacillus kochii]